jgi:resuscitation-promoting factor RpfA
MLPGNGRHRRPRQAPAIVVAAGVTGSAIAIPLLGAANAHAVDGVTWDRLALCESGGTWKSVPGNGHYGGLQLTQEEWVAYGGLVYALSPDKATRSEQIAVAEKVLAAKGPDAWPGCAVMAGLPSAGDDGAGPSPSDSESADPSGGSGGTDDPSGDSSGDPSGDPSGDANGGDGSAGEATPSGTPTPSGDATSEPGGGKQTDPAGSPSPSTSQSAPPSRGPGGDSEAGGGKETEPSGKGSGRHRGDHADEPEGGDGGDRASDPAGRHASRGGAEGKGRDSKDGTYRVRVGDNLWTIAKAHDLAEGWTALYETNRKIIGTDPDLILPGQLLHLS